MKEPPNLQGFIEQNLPLLKNNRIIVIDSGGGAPLKQFAEKYVEKDIEIWKARKLGYSFVETKYILNLDCDNVLPMDYVKEAYRILEEDKADAVSIDFEKPQGHLGFGCSIWKTDVLKRLYTYPPKPVEKLIKIGEQQWVTAFQNGFCECTYEWAKLISNSGRLETLPYRAKHLK